MAWLNVSGLVQMRVPNRQQSRGPFSIPPNIIDISLSSSIYVKVFDLCFFNIKLVYLCMFFLLYGWVRLFVSTVFLNILWIYVYFPTMNFKSFPNIFQICKQIISKFGYWRNIEERAIHSIIIPQTEIMIKIQSLPYIQCMITIDFHTYFTYNGFIW